MFPKSTEILVFWPTLNALCMTDKNGLHILVSHLSICQRRKMKLISAGRAILPLAEHAGVVAFYDVI